MANQLFQQMNQQPSNDPLSMISQMRANGANPMQIVQQLISMKADPNQIIQQMMNSGAVSQEQYNAAVQNAEKFRSTFGGR